MSDVLKAAGSALSILGFVGMFVSYVIFTALWLFDAMEQPRRYWYRFLPAFLFVWGMLTLAFYTYPE